MDIKIVEAPSVHVNELPFEIVERKGIGHPDTLCDAIAERASQLYSRYFLETYGRLAHHWFDKVMLIGGQSNMGYGYGELTQPYKVIFAGKGVLSVGEQKIPVENIFWQAAEEVLTSTLREFDASKNLVVVSELIDYRGPVNKKSRYTPDKPEDLFDPADNQRVSNDCNVCNGFAPFSKLEQIVKGVEEYLRSPEYMKINKDTGLDIKIVGTRKESVVELFINIPFIAKHISSYDVYLKRVNEVYDDVLQYLAERSDLEIKLVVNPQNVNGQPYLTVTGTVADTGDLGVVGRGNRLNGLITPMRPMSIEASSGKNPIDHTGKLYGVLSQKIADRISKELGVDNQTHITTLKERPLDNPQDVLVYIHEEQSPETRKKINEIIQREVSNVFDITDELIHKGVVMW